LPLGQGDNHVPSNMFPPPFLRGGQGCLETRRSGFSSMASHSRRDCVGFSPTCSPVVSEAETPPGDLCFLKHDMRI